MAVGFTEDVPTLNAQLGNYSVEVMNMYTRIKDIYGVLNQNCTTAVMNGLNIAAGDQTTINAVIGSYNLIVQCFEGTLTAPQEQDLRFTLRTVRGFQ